MTMRRENRRLTGSNITVGYIEATPDDKAAIMEILNAASPQGRIDRWRPLSIELGVAGDLLDEAESLIDDQGSMKEHRDRFNLLLLQAKTAIISAGNEQTIIPKARAGEKHSRTQSERRQRRDTWKGLSASERETRDQKIVTHYRKTQLSVSGFAEKHAAKYGLKPRRVRYILEKALGSLPG